MTHLVELQVYFDGASRGNPGPAGAGVNIKSTSSKHSIDLSLKKYLGEKTNNQAEYEAIILGLKKVIQLIDQYPISQVTIRGDSQLVIRHLTGEYQVNSDNLIDLYTLVTNLITSIQRQDIDIKLEHIYRDNNSKADKLANKAIDRSIN